MPAARSLRTDDVRGPRGRTASLAAALFLLSLCACQGTRNLQDPTLTIRTPGGNELGVSTDYGVVFLGRTARSGAVEVTAWYGDGPSVESSVIEPLGGGLYTAEMEIRLPKVPMSFEAPDPGDSLLVIGRRGASLWQAQASVQRDPRVEGILISIPSQLEDAPDQVGAGVFQAAGGGQRGKRLVGLVSGRLDLFGADGSRRSYLTVVGPEQLWRLVTRRTEIERKRRWVYREDIL